MKTLLHATKIAGIAFMGFFSIAGATEIGERLYIEKCSYCHFETRPSFDKMNTMVAPPMMGVLYHVTEVKRNKGDAVAFMSDYIMNPDRSKALCQKQSIDKFGVMPSQKDILTRDEARIVSEYIYDRFSR